MQAPTFEWSCTPGAILFSAWEFEGCYMFAEFLLPPQEVEWEHRYGSLGQGPQRGGSADTDNQNPLLPLLLTGLISALGLMSMLIAMTFNAGLFISLVAGEVVGGALWRGAAGGRGGGHMRGASFELV
ncbi:hypothetical protein JKP88DRAFT_350938 [Tribonema minus]|uniref:Copper transport protein n=1 Tax=Tribonema minus TaxID=303371 RepID=A0A835YLP5_9STRA|nr:hypothetical protein JKP88DRAFT_350938 [Tribonema minus]